MIKIVYVLLFLLIVGCKEDKEMEEPGPIDCYNLRVGLQLSFLNQKGEDLLSSDTESYFPFEPMRLRHDINGRIQEVYNPLLDSPRGISLTTKTSPYRLRVRTYGGKEGITSDQDGIQKGENIAYLQLNEQITDTLRTEWEASECYFINRKLWYNGVLYDPIPEVIEIVK